MKAKMSAKKWCISFVCIVLAVLLVLAGFNIAVDPFGIFGDNIFEWYSYNMTNNPRAAKIAYLDEHHDEYDSYLVGASATSSFPKEDLDKYYDASFYNMIKYGADMRDTEEICYYLVNNYTVDNLVVCLTLTYGGKYDYESDPLTGSMHAKTDGSSELLYYLRYAFANPRYSIEKLNNLQKDEYLSEPFDTFDVESGAYDKLERDIEPIDSLENYLTVYPEFTDYTTTKRDMPYIDETVESLKRIVKFCKEKGVNLDVIFAPLYYDFVTRFDPSEVTEFYTRVSEVIPFWDFSVSELSHDPRFFYDDTHFRNALGKMSLAKMFGDTEVYAPEDLGVYITPENAEEYVKTIWGQGTDTGSYTKNVPILMYHNIGDENLPSELLEEHIKGLYDAGYTGVSFDEMIDYVEKGTHLPEKPVCITFDDGYYSNYEYAYPILEKYNMKATIFVIGSSVGSKTNYKDTDYPITPHFDFSEAKEMVNSGLVSIQSHTYDMHQWAPYESGDNVRTSILPFEGESEEDYINVVRKDFEKSADEIYKGTGVYPNVLAYPLGESNDLSAAILSEMGVKATLSIGGRGNLLIKGLPQSLYCLSRFYVQDDTTADEIINYVIDKG